MIRETPGTVRSPDQGYPVAPSELPLCDQSFPEKKIRRAGQDGGAAGDARVWEGGAQPDRRAGKSVRA